MRLYYLTMLITMVSIPLLLLANAPISGNATQDAEQSSLKDFASKTFVVINTDGDLSLNPEQNMNLWNPHAVGLTSASNWRITFVNETEMWLETSASETGHIATGSWWTTSFLTRQRLSIYTSEPVRIAASFRINVLDVDLSSGNEWLRIALACAIQRSDESIVYTEMDLWDSLTALAHPSGNIRLGGDVVYNGGDVVEYKIDQVTIACSPRSSLA